MGDFCRIYLLVVLSFLSICLTTLEEHKDHDEFNLADFFDDENTDDDGLDLFNFIESMKDTVCNVVFSCTADKYYTVSCGLHKPWRLACFKFFFVKPFYGEALHSMADYI